MLNSNLIILHDTLLLIPDSPDKDTKYRLGKYQRWLESQAMNWLQPDLQRYSDYLSEEAGLKKSTVNSHLGTIRGRYRAILNDHRLRDFFYSHTPSGASPSDRKAVVDEHVMRLEMAVTAKVNLDVVEKQDVADSEHLRLTIQQAEALMKLPGIETIKGLRDTAIIGLLLCTGIRENELRMLDVSDLRQTLNGEISLHIRNGKGSKARLIPYGELSWILAYLDTWLESAQIETGAVFRGFYRGNKTLRSQRISLRQISYILDEYQIMVNGELRRVQPHDCRRTYARRLFDAGMDVNRIRENLGHKSLQTTLGYIGEISPHERRPPAVYQSPHSLKMLTAI